MVEQASPSWILFGGSFNPFHQGHLELIHAARAAMPHARICLIPAAAPPHKLDQKPLPFQHRVDMLRECVGKVDARILVSDIEQKLPAPTYTFNTILELKKPGALLESAARTYFLVGGDSLTHFHKWYRFQDLLNEVELLVAPRPGYCRKTARENLAKAVPVSLLNRIHFIDMKECGLASSQIRAKLQQAQNKSELRAALPAGIFDYLERHQLFDYLLCAE